MNSIQTTKIHFLDIPNEIQPVVKGTADSCIVKMNEIHFSIFKSTMGSSDFSHLLNTKSACIPFG